MANSSVNKEEQKPDRREATVRQTEVCWQRERERQRKLWWENDKVSWSFTSHTGDYRLISGGTRDLLPHYQLRGTKPRGCRHTRTSTSPLVTVHQQQQQMKTCVRFVDEAPSSVWINKDNLMSHRPETAPVLLSVTAALVVCRERAWPVVSDVSFSSVVCCFLFFPGTSSTTLVQRRHIGPSYTVKWTHRHTRVISPPAGTRVASADVPFYHQDRKLPAEETTVTTVNFLQDRHVWNLAADVHQGCSDSKEGTGTNEDGDRRTHPISHVLVKVAPIIRWLKGLRGNFRFSTFSDQSPTNLKLKVSVPSYYEHCHNFTLAK